MAAAGNILSLRRRVPPFLHVMLTGLLAFATWLTWLLGAARIRSKHHHAIPLKPVSLYLLPEGESIPSPF